MKNSTALVLRMGLAILIVAIAVAPLAMGQSKRPLTLRDFDGWRNIQNQTLSRDGKFLAYGLFPQEGDGVVVVRNLQSGTEWRQAAGARPEPTPADPESDAPPVIPSVTIQFTADSKFVVFSVFPSKAERDKFKKLRAPRPEDTPRNGMVIVDLSSGTAVRVERVKNFEVPDKVGGTIAYLREAAPGTPAASPAPPTTDGDEMGWNAEGEDQGRGGQGGGRGNAGSGGGTGRREYGTELALRNLTTQAERNFADVLTYTLSKDAATLVYAVSSRKEETNGIFTVETGSDSAPRAILAGPGRYSRLTWDEEQAQLAFMSDRDDAKAKQPKVKLYLWARKSDAPLELVTPATPGFRDGFLASDRGNINFSRDGKHIFFGCAPPAEEAPDPANDVAAEDKVNADLWHWKDEHIQPMQRVRAAQDRNRTYRAVYYLAEKKLVQLGDPMMRDVTTTSDDGLWALGTDDHAYGPILEYDEQYYDFYLVNTRTGERNMLLRKHNGGVTMSPDARYALYYDAKAWKTISLTDGRETTLTGNAGVNFWREDYDLPGAPSAYGSAGWTKDGKYILLYDEFDVWRMTPNGGEAVNLTKGAGRSAHLEFRYVRFGNDPRDPDGRWIDPAQPLLLRATDKETYDTGFYRTRLDAAAAPQKLTFAAKAFANPVKARDADVVVLTGSSFEEFPDLLITDSNFARLQKVSNANPQQSEVNWGTAELIHFRNADGVALKGALFKPENFDPKKKYPMIVYIYEKLSQNVHAYVAPAPRHTINATFYSSNGYLILQPDIVYTIGQPGQSALKCVLPAIDAVIARGFVDEKNIGIEGHSWGGYQIAYMITQTNRFKAVEAGAPVANMTSAYDGIRWGPGLPRQFQYERTQSRIGASLWAAPLKFVENSPIFMADRIRTPLLILQNDADTAVPWYQGIEYFLALRRLGKEVYMFTYNGAPHGLTRRADQKDFTVRMQQYFDYFLKGAPKPEWMEKGIPFLDRDAEKERLKQKTGVY